MMYVLTNSYMIGATTRAGTYHDAAPKFNPGSN
jgi:hypothetical protein